MSDPSAPESVFCKEKKKKKKKKGNKAPKNEGKKRTWKLSCFHRREKCLQGQILRIKLFNVSFNIGYKLLKLHSQDDFNYLSKKEIIQNTKTFTFYYSIRKPCNLQTMFKM